MLLIKYFSYWNNPCVVKAMRIQKTLLILVIFCSSAFMAKTSLVFQIDNTNVDQKKAKISPFKPGEKLKYVLHYGLLNAGIAELEVKNSTRKFDRRKALNMVGKGWTTGATDWFFTVNDHYETFMDTERMESLLFIRRVNEGGFLINQDYYFEQDSNKVRTQNNIEYHVPEGVQDMLSTFYYARTIDYSNAKMNDVFTIPAFVDDKVEYLRIKYKGKERIKVRNGEYDCLKFNPIVLEGRVFKDDDDLTVWISDDDNKIPILIKSKILVGSIKAELSEYHGLANPLAKNK